MLAKNQLRIDEPQWAISHVRRNRTRLPFDTIEQAKREHGYARMMRYPVASELTALAWDRMAMRLVRSATTEEELRDALKQTRTDSAPYAYALRKLGRIFTQKALAAETIADTERFANRIPGFCKRPRSVNRKIDAFLAEFKASASTMEDFQRIFYYAREPKLRMWAEDNWDRLSKEEVDTARSLEALKEAHVRARLVLVDGFYASCGWRRTTAEEYAAAKWDSVALAKANRAKTRRQCRALLTLTRRESLAETVLVQKALALETNFAGAKELHRSHGGTRSSEIRALFEARLLELCETAADAVWLYQGHHVTADTGKKLIRRFSELVSD